MNNSLDALMQNSPCQICGQELRLDRPGYIFTGGTCVGKSTVLNELKERGYTVIEEAAKAIIRENELQPGCNRGSLQEQIFARQLEWETKFYSCACNRHETGPVFADRCLIDSMTYAMHFQEPVSQELKAALPALAKLRYTKSFLFENLGFFETDGRVESAEQGLAFSLLMAPKLKDSYQRYQIPVVLVKAMTVEERVQFILEECGLAVSGKTKHWEYIKNLAHY